MIGVTEKPETEHVLTLRTILIPTRSALTLKPTKQGRAAAPLPSVRIDQIKTFFVKLKLFRSSTKGRLPEKIFLKSWDRLDLMVGDGLTKGKNDFVPKIFLQEAFPKKIDYKGWEWIL